jgi:PAS domain S-box-containing protein
VLPLQQVVHQDRDEEHHDDHEHDPTHDLARYAYRSGVAPHVPVGDDRYRALIESISDYAIFWLDPEGRVTSWNLGAQRFNGYTADEIVGKHFSTFYTDDARASGHPEHELEIARREGRYEEEGWRVRKGGSLFWASVVITAVWGDDGNLVGFAKVTRDITERKQMLEALERQAIELRQANEALSAVARDRTEFLAVTAHELRTPVTIVNGFSATLRDRWDALTEAQRLEMINALARGGERLSGLVDELLTASRLEAGVLEVHATDFDLAGAVAEVVGDLAIDADAVITTDLEPAWVHADRSRVLQMVTNYVTNALRYGGPPIVVTTAPMAGGIVLRVNDSGTGVPPELVPRLFDKFARGSTDQGTGLGLFIVRELARAQGGEAWYETRAGGGSCFALRLPSATKQ